MAEKQPASINGIEFDALLNMSYAMEASSPDYVVESGFTINDSIILSAEVLDLTLFVSDRPVTFKSRFGSGDGRVDQVVKALKDLYYEKELVSVTLSDSQYDDMAITSLTISRTNELGYAMEIPITLKHVRSTESKTTAIPASYGKSGKTKSSAGTAGTSSGSSNTSSSSSESSLSSSSSSSSSSSGSSSSANTSRSSILYNVASGIGLI